MYKVYKAYKVYKVYKAIKRKNLSLPTVIYMTHYNKRKSECGKKTVKKKRWTEE